MDEVITHTLKSADNEGTAAPYWLIIDPECMVDTSNIHEIAYGISGPFFSRFDAEEYLKNKAHRYSNKTKVYCCSGHTSRKYFNFCKKLGLG